MDVTTRITDPEQIFRGRGLGSRFPLCRSRTVGIYRGIYYFDLRTRPRTRVTFPVSVVPGVDLVHGSRERRTIISEKKTDTRVRGPDPTLEVKGPPERRTNPCMKTFLLVPLPTTSPVLHGVSYWTRYQSGSLPLSFVCRKDREMGVR